MVERERNETENRNYFGQVSIQITVVVGTRKEYKYSTVSASVLMCECCSPLSLPSAASGPHVVS